MSAFSVENPHDGKTFENYTRFEWGVEVGVVTTFMLRLFVPHEFDMEHSISYSLFSVFFHRYIGNIVTGIETIQPKLTHQNS